MLRTIMPRTRTDHALLSHNPLLLGEPLRFEHCPRRDCRREFEPRNPRNGPHGRSSLSWYDVQYL